MGRNKYKIVDATIELIRRNGFGATSIDDILKSSGVQKSNFYYHFANKEECAMAAVDRMLELVDENLWQEILSDKSLSPKSRLEKLVESLAHRFETEGGKVGDPFGNLAAELSDNHPRFQAKLNDYFIRYAAHLEGVIQEGIEEEEMRQSLIPREAAEAFLAMMQGAYLLSRAYQDIGAFRRNLDFFLSTICV